MKRAAMLIILLASCDCISQNSTFNWYFGNAAALSFTTDPPTILNNNAMNANAGCSSISDQSGNLLFYTDGNTVWNKSHSVMQNGTGLLCYGGPQSSLIVKKPASTSVYYIFTVYEASMNTSTSNIVGLYYSEVDVSLGSGQGSVNVKNTKLGQGIYTSKLCAVNHCNGQDIWLAAREWTCAPGNSTCICVPCTGTFHSYLVTSAGVNPNPVISSPTTYFTPSWWPNCSYCYKPNFGPMKLSPTGKKIALANGPDIGFNEPQTELYDFNNSTGITSNGIIMNLRSSPLYGVGLEFSPDGTYLFESSKTIGSSGGFNGIIQYDLCATTPSSSSYSVAVNGTLASMQLASDGKIYIAHPNTSSLSVINSPTVFGSGMNFSLMAQSVTPGVVKEGLPGFNSSLLLKRDSPQMFTYTYGSLCRLIAFTAAPPVSISGCSATAYTSTGISWDFGEPQSLANTSTLSSPTHSYANSGNYTVTLVYHYSCGGGTDTLRSIVNVAGPQITVNSTAINCANLGTASVTATGGSGSYTYSWTPFALTTSAVINLIPGTYTVGVYDVIAGCSMIGQFYLPPLVPLSGSLAASPSVQC